MPLNDTATVMAFKHETTPGTAIALAAADGAINVFNGRVFDDTDVILREGQVSFDPIKASIGARLGRATFQTDVYPGSGSLPFWASVLLPACGWVAAGNVLTRRTQAVGANVKTLTIGKWTTDGTNTLFEQIHGAMGTATITCVAGRTCSIDWTFVGVFSEPTDVAIISPSYPTVNPLRFVSSGLTVGSYTPKIEQLVFDLGNDVVVLPDSRGARGFSYANMRASRMTLTINPETGLVSASDYWGDLEDRTERAISVAMSEGGIGVTLAAPAAQLVSPPAPGERGGARIDDLVYQLNRGTSPGDDSCSITFDITP